MSINNESSRFNIRSSGSIYNSFVGSSIAGNVTGSNYNISDKQEILADAANEIQQLLKQLEENNPTATELEQVTYINIATKPDLKKRVIAVLKEQGDTAIDKFILENKHLKVVKEWTQLIGLEIDPQK